MKQTVLITGCSKGIGRAILNELHKTGLYTIYGLVRGQESVKSIDLADVKLFSCDLADSPATKKTVEKILKSSGGIDILINNAGLGIFKPADVMKLEEWDRVIATNLTAPFIMMNGLLPAMKKKNFGRIINITSDAERVSYADAGAYCASKAGLKLLSDCIRKEVDGYNIHVTTIAPGRVDTYFNNKQPGQRPRSLQPQDVAMQVVSVLSSSDRAEVEQVYLNSSLEKPLH